MNNPLKPFFQFIGLLLFQLFVLNNINLGGYVTPYAYILFIALYPAQYNKGLFMLLAFGTGLVVDIFELSGGLHAMGSVFAAYIRNWLLTATTGESIKDLKNFNPRNIPFSKLALFLFLLTLAHHTVLFTFEALSWAEIDQVIPRVVLSTAASLLVQLLLIYLSIKPKRI